MKIMGLFSNGFLIGRVYNGRGYVDGIDMGPCSDHHSSKPINVKTLKVYKKTKYDIVETKGETMELVKRDGSVAVVKDEYDKQHIAVLHSTFYSEDLHKMLITNILITKEERRSTASNDKKRWILL